MRKILFLVSTEFDQLKGKIGQERAALALKERDEGGYFDHVYHVAFPTRSRQVIRLGPRHTLVECAKDRFNFLRRFKLLHNILNAIVFILQVRKLVITEQVDIIRAIDPGEQAIYAFTVAKLTHRPWCVSIHADRDLYHRLAGTFIIFGSRRLSKAIEGFAIKKAPLVLAISQYIARWAVKKGAKQEKVRVVYHGIEIKSFTEPLQGVEGIDLTGKRIVSFVGRLSKEKYVYDVVSIAEEILQSCKDVVLIVIGSGPEEALLEKKIRETGLANSVKLLGARSNKVANGIRRISDVNLCLLSGFSLIEAAMSGRPIVAYDVEWHNELIKNDYSGILVGEHDTKKAAMAINLLLKDNKLGRRLAENAKTLAFQRHSIARASQDKINCYQELLQSTK